MVTIVLLLLAAKPSDHETAFNCPELTVAKGLLPDETSKFLLYVAGKPTLLKQERCRQAGSKEPSFTYERWDIDLNESGVHACLQQPSYQPIYEYTYPYSQPPYQAGLAKNAVVSGFCKQYRLNWDMEPEQGYKARKWIRTISSYALKRILFFEESYRLSALEKPVTLEFLSRLPVRIVGEGSVVLQKSTRMDSQLQLYFDRRQFILTTKRIVCPSQLDRAQWGDSVTALTLSAKVMGRRGRHTLEFRAL